MPRLAEYAGRLAAIPFDFDEILAALAPRTCFISAPKGDTNFQWQSVDRVAASAREVYQLYGVPEALQVEHPECGHDFPEAMRTLAYAALERAIR